MVIRKRFVLMLLAAVLAGCHAEAPVPQERVLQVATMTPQQSDGYQLQRRFVGRVAAAQRVDIGFEQAGKIEKLSVNQGDAVNEGQELARLDRRLLQVEARELKAQLREADARLELVRSSLKRQRSLKQQGFSAEQKLDELGAEKQVLLASLDRLRAGIDANQLQIEKAVLVAPYDGVISRRFQDQGAVVAAGSPVFQLLESARLEVIVGVPVAMAASLVPGDEYDVTIGGDTYAASLLTVGSDLDAVSRTIKLRLALPVQDPRDGELALLNLAESRPEQGFWLPVSALIDGMRGLWNCYVVEASADGRYRVEAVNAQVLHVEQDRVYVAGDLAGKRVITSGLHRVAPGQLVLANELAAN